MSNRVSALTLISRFVSGTVFVQIASDKGRVCCLQRHGCDSECVETRR